MSTAAGNMSKFNDTIDAVFPQPTTLYNSISSTLSYENEILNGVEYRPIKPAPIPRSEQQIISDISGGDMTEGSCSSLALAYAGNRAGYIVYDFRDGRSREFFSSRTSIERIANMDGVDSKIIYGTDDTV